MVLPTPSQKRGPAPDAVEGPQVTLLGFCQALRVWPRIFFFGLPGGRGVDSGGERRRRPLLTQFTTPKQCPDQQRQILVRRHHARFLQRGFSWKRQQRQAVECGNGRAAQEARGPQVTAFCQAFRLCPPHRGRGVDSGGERRRRPQHMCSLTIQKMAVIGSRRVFFRPTARPSCRHPGTRPSRSGTWNWARARRRWKATGTFVSFPRSPGERRRFRGGEA